MQNDPKNCVGKKHIRCIGVEKALVFLFFFAQCFQYSEDRIVKKTRRWSVKKATKHIEKKRERKIVKLMTIASFKKTKNFILTGVKCKNPKWKKSDSLSSFLHSWLIFSHGISRHIFSRWWLLLIYYFPFFPLLRTSLNTQRADL